MKRTIKNIIIVVILVLFAISFSGCYSQESFNNEASNVSRSDPVAYSDVDYSKDIAPYSYDNGIIYSNSLLSRTAPYASVEEQAVHSDAIVIGKVLSSTVFFEDEKIFTVHELEIEDAIKGGFELGEKLYFREKGGATTYGEMLEHQVTEEKDFIDNPDEKLFPEDTVFVCGVDGHFPLKDGQEALLFLVDCTGCLEEFDKPLYGVVRTYDGKFYKMEDGAYWQVIGNTEGKLVTDSTCWSLTDQDIEDLKKKIN